MGVLGRSTRNVVANWEAAALNMAASGIVVAAAAAGIVASAKTAATLRQPIPLATTELVSMVVSVFPTAAAARVYSDAERSGARRVFTFRAWAAGGRAAWGRVLVIEMIDATIAVAALLASAPYFFYASVPLVVVFVVTIIWSRKAIVTVAGRGAGVGAALRDAWRDLGHHLGAALLLVIVNLLMTALLGPIGGAAADCWLLAACAAMTEAR
ncbi:MAG TPA: hypothetical protein VJZ76_13065 [Thermoanaerobaculia bacterium]|nr:hypothetical protein [Thermoanaerobaculia bacterium]